MSAYPDFYVVGVRDCSGVVTKTVCSETGDTICLQGRCQDVPWNFESDAHHLSDFADEHGFEHFCIPYVFADLSGPAVPVSNRPVSELGKQEAERQIERLERQVSCTCCHGGPCPTHDNVQTDPEGAFYTGRHHLSRPIFDEHDSDADIKTHFDPKIFAARLLATLEKFAPGAPAAPGAPEPNPGDVAHMEDIEFCKNTIATLSEQVQKLSSRLDSVYRRGL